MVEEEAERLLVAGAGQLDEGDQPGAVGFGVLRRGGQVGVAEATRATAAGRDDRVREPDDAVASAYRIEGPGGAG